MVASNTGFKVSFFLIARVGKKENLWREVVIDAKVLYDWREDRNSSRRAPTG